MFWATADCRKARWTFCWYTRIWLGVMLVACGVCCCCWRPGTFTPAEGREGALVRDVLCFGFELEKINVLLLPLLLLLLKSFALVLSLSR